MNDWHIVQVRRRSLREWMAWLVWLLVLGILLEYASASFAEQEPQAGIVASALFLGLLLAGIVIEGVKIVETKSGFHDKDKNDER